MQLYVMLARNSHRFWHIIYNESGYLNQHTAGQYTFAGIWIAVLSYHSYHSEQGMVTCMGARWQTQNVKEVWKHFYSSEEHHTPCFPSQQYTIYTCGSHSTYLQVVCKHANKIKPQNHNRKQHSMMLFLSARDQ